MKSTEVAVAFTVVRTKNLKLTRFSRRQAERDSDRQSHRAIYAIIWCANLMTLRCANGAAIDSHKGQYPATSYSTEAASSTVN